VGFALFDVLQAATDSAVAPAIARIVNRVSWECSEVTDINVLSIVGFSEPCGTSRSDGSHHRWRCWVSAAA
jgi:hypothetical protein